MMNSHHDPPQNMLTGMNFDTYTKHIRGLLRCASLLILVFIRFNFGERFFNWFYLVVAAGMYYGGFFLFLLIFGAASGAVLRLYAVAVVLMFAFHSIEIRLRRSKPIRLHSQYQGTSYGFWYGLDPLHQTFFGAPLTQETVQFWLEPVAVFLVGFILGFIVSGPVEGLGLWLMVAAMALFWTQWLDAEDHRARLLDMVDAEIEAENMDAALHGVRDAAQETEGVMLHGVQDLADKLDTAALRQRMDAARHAARTKATDRPSPASDPIPIADNTAEDDASAEPTPCKRGRGRPRKEQPLHPA